MKNNTLSIAIDANYQISLTDVAMCRHPGCEQGAMKCTNYMTGKVTYYCPMHSVEHDYCWQCGMYLGNNGKDHEILCENCKELIFG